MPEDEETKDDETSENSPLADFKEAALERFKSPLAGSYLFFFAGVNWDLVALYVFSPRTLELVGLKALEANTPLVELTANWWLPLVFTILYVFASPALIEFFTRYRTITRGWVGNFGRAMEVLVLEKQEKIETSRREVHARLDNQGALIAPLESKLKSLEAELLLATSSIEEKTVNLSKLKTALEATGDLVAVLGGKRRILWATSDKKNLDVSAQLLGQFGFDIRVIEPAEVITELDQSPVGYWMVVTNLVHQEAKYGGEQLVDKIRSAFPAENRPLVAIFTSAKALEARSNHLESIDPFIVSDTHEGLCGKIALSSRINEVVTELERAEKGKGEGERGSSTIALEYFKELERELDIKPKEIYSQVQEWLRKEPTLLGK